MTRVNPSLRGPDFINFTLRRSLSVKTSSAEELPWTAIEQAAKERIYRDDRPNKPFLIVAGKEKLTKRKQVIYHSPLACTKKATKKKTYTLAFVT